VIGVGCGAGACGEFVFWGLRSTPPERWIWRSLIIDSWQLWRRRHLCFLFRRLCCCCFCCVLLLLLCCCFFFSRPLLLGGIASRCFVSNENDGGRHGSAVLFKANLEAHRCSHPDNLTNLFFMAATRHNLPSL